MDDKWDDKWDPLDRATLDHLIPVCKPVQTNKDENLIMACMHCNGLRGLKDPMKFYRTIRRQPTGLGKSLPATYSKNEEKREKQIMKQGKLLAYCLIVVHYWPDQAQKITEFKTRQLKSRMKYAQQINVIRLRISKNNLIKKY